MDDPDLMEISQPYEGSLSATMRKINRVLQTKRESRGPVDKDNVSSTFSLMEPPRKGFPVEYSKGK